MLLDHYELYRQTEEQQYNIIYRNSECSLLKRLLSITRCERNLIEKRKKRQHAIFPNGAMVLLMAGPLSPHSNKIKRKRSSQVCNSVFIY